VARRYNNAPAPETKLDWPELINEALTAPGRRGNTYIQGHDYSYLNNLRLYAQGVNEPTTSYKGWQALGRQVRKSEKGYKIIRPITMKSKTEVDEHGQPKTYMKFKDVNGAFTYSQTDGEPLSEELTTPPEWTTERALGVLGIALVKFQDTSLNTQGYSVGRQIAISPVAAYPLKTTIHEIAHVEAGHTTAGLEDYVAGHRGLPEFEAEGTAYLAMHELGLAEQMNAAESRNYIKSWLQGETPPDASIRKVFKLTDIILKAGRTSHVNAEVA
jgi:antirestriction protein ArdC